MITMETLNRRLNHKPHYEPTKYSAKTSEIELTKKQHDKIEYEMMLMKVSMKELYIMAPQLFS